MTRTILMIALMLAVHLPAVAQDERDESSHEGHNHGPVSSAPVAAASQTGTITVHTIQGTEGGPAVTSGNVFVQFLGHGRQVNRLDAKLDANGVAVFENVPLAVPFRPQVTVEYAGASYQAMGDVMKPGNPSQEITVKVFETTDQEPDWQVKMWHVVFNITPDGIQVIHMMVAQNPTDRAWLGAVDSEGNRYSVVLRHPKGAHSIKMGGALHTHNTRLLDDAVASTATLMPGTSMYRIEYVLPVTESDVTIPLTTPAKVTQLRVFFPDDPVLKLHSESLKSLGQGRYELSGERTVEVFAASDLPGGKQINMVISGISRPLSSDEIAAGSPYLARGIAAIGTLALLVACAVAMLRKRGSDANSDHA